MPDLSYKQHRLQLASSEAGEQIVLLGAIVEQIGSIFKLLTKKAKSACPENKAYFAEIKHELADLASEVSELVQSLSPEFSLEQMVELGAEQSRERRQDG